jgi:hypothetical protein
MEKRNIPSNCIINLRGKHKTYGSLLMLKIVTYLDPIPEGDYIQRILDRMHFTFLEVHSPKCYFQQNSNVVSYMAEILRN